ncbi:hypothetical protein TRAPUB_5908 [Trametes pubescens]|uniref:F-box domain-containing protein n=1 Tax=Trametes pubescens TaxID=154538 RepID=A0A1M2V7A5_TRAPU|nr:hypothetical protein TRAPUB_5908 [Trametes pubescens]
MFNKIVKYLRKQRSRFRARGRHQARALTLEQEAVPHEVRGTWHFPPRLQTPSVHWLVPQPESEESRAPYRDLAAHELDVPTHLQEDSTPKEGFSADGDTKVVDPLTLRRAWNSFASFDELPDEILIEVFLCAGVVHDNDTSPVELTRYMLVCRRWRDVIVSHACFWNTIAVQGRSAPWFRLALRRSQLAMLHLESDAPTLASVLPDLVPHRDRIRSLQVGYCQSYVQFMAVSSFIQAPFESLTALHIETGTDDRPNTGYVGLLPEHYPQLENLSLRGLHIQWTASLMSGLTYLDLNRCSLWPSLMDGDTFLDVLQQGQSLEVLSLRYFMSAACSAIPSRDRPAFTLPRLHEIVLVDKEQWVQQFMAFVRARRPRELALTSNFGIGDLDNAPLGHHGLVPAPDVPLFSGTGSRLHLHAFTTEARGALWRHRGSSTEYRTWAIHAPSLAEDIIRFIRPLRKVSTSTLCMLDIKMPMRGVRRDILDAFLDEAPHLRWLHLGCGQDLSHPLPTDIFDSLATRTGGSDTAAAAVRCPKLTYLGLGGLHWDGGAVMEAALSCLRTRAQMGPTVKQLEYLKIRIWGIWTGVEKDRRWFRPTEVWCGTLLQEMVSREFSIAIGLDLCGVY